MSPKLIILLVTIGVSTTLNAQQAIPGFSLPDVLTNQTVALDSYPANLVIAVIFTSNICPYDKYYTDRIRSLISQYNGKVQFLLVNSHLGGEESIEEMQKTYANWALAVPYLADKDQAVMTMLDAKKSPEVFLLRRDNNKYNVLYTGAIDDNPQISSAVTANYLKTAIDQALAGKGDATTVRAVGCTIRKK